jgi:hypothetical protein
MRPIRKYNLCVNLQKDKEKKGIWKNIGEIAVWLRDNGQESLQTTLYMFPDLNIGTFLEQPRTAEPTVTNPPVDMANLAEEIKDINF